MDPAAVALMYGRQVHFLPPSAQPVGKRPEHGVRGGAGAKVRAPYNGGMSSVFHLLRAVSWDEFQAAEIPGVEKLPGDGKYVCPHGLLRRGQRHAYVFTANGGKTIMLELFGGGQDGDGCAIIRAVADRFGTSDASIDWYGELDVCSAEWDAVCKRDDPDYVRPIRTVGDLVDVLQTYRRELPVKGTWEGITRPVQQVFTRLVKSNGKEQQTVLIDVD